MGFQGRAASEAQLHPSISNFAENSTWTGSIGVVIPHYDLSGLLAQYDVKDDSIASHPYKLMGSPTRGLSEEDRATERKLLQSLVDESFGRFKQVVLSGRPAFRDDPGALEASATGQIFSADQAKERGLVDQIGFVEDAVARAAELAGVSLEDVRCVKYKKPPAALDALLGVDADHVRRHALRSDFASLLGVVAQRLIRTVCSHCRQEYDVSEADLAKLSLDPNIKKLSRGTGCPKCLKSGYKGRKGIYELLVPDENVRFDDFG